MPNRINTDIYRKKYDEEYFEELNRKYPGKKHILHVGRKTEQKNLDTVIRAMKYVDDASVVFVGQGEDDKYKKIAEKEKVLDRCYFVDRVESDLLPLWYSWCDCFCTPSRWEGFGYVFIEAAACEAAVITSNIAPMNEYLTDGYNSILINEYENPEKIASAINSVLRDTEEVREMRRKARQVGLGFCKDVIDKQEIEIYKGLMEISPNNRNNNILKYRTILYENAKSIYNQVKNLIL